MFKQNSAANMLTILSGRVFCKPLPDVHLVESQRKKWSMKKKKGKGKGKARKRESERTS